MNDLAEVVKVACSREQNEALEGALANFYKVAVTPKVEKAYFVLKDSYTKFLRTKMRERTPYEGAKNFSELQFNDKSLPFLVSYSQITFKFPSGRAVILTEHLSEPNGTTQAVALADSGGINCNYFVSEETPNPYLLAESEVIARFLEEIGE